MIKHSVEKIGGTSMSRYDDVLKNIWQRRRYHTVVLKKPYISVPLLYRPMPV